MKASASSSGYSALPSLTTSDTGGGPTPSPAGDIGSFDDVLQGQVALQPSGSSAVPFADFSPTEADLDKAAKLGDGASSSGNAASPDPGTRSETMRALVDPSSSTAGIPGKVSETPVSSHLNSKKAIVPKVRENTIAEEAGTPEASSMKANGPSYLGVTGILIRASLLAAQPKLTAKAIGLPAAQEGTKILAEDAPATLGTSIEALADKVASLKIAGRLGGLLFAEKKSGEAKEKGIFLQASAASSDPLWPHPFAEQSLPGAAQMLAPQPVGSSEDGSSPLDSDAMESAGGIAGMANGKKATEMNATLDLPEIDLSSMSNSAGQASPDLDVHIVLGTNHDFQEALQQVMHVAEHSGLSPLTPPLRIAIEIQTPPGAVVNVYIFRQHDQYRAQLSASDPQALSWVQDQIGVLRETTDADVAVRWLPAQLEPSAASDQKCSFTWGDSNQQGRQGNSHLADDRQQSRQRKPGWSGRVAAVETNDFSSALGALGRAA